MTANPFALFSSLNPINFVDAWTLGGFGGYFWNTVVITSITVVGMVALSVAGRLRASPASGFRGNNIIFFVFVLGLMIPFFSVMIPLFYELQGLGLLGTKAAVILPAIAGASGFGVPVGRVPDAVVLHGPAGGTRRRR